MTAGFIYECEGHSQEGHGLAAEHPVIVVGRQSLIDNQEIAIVVPLTSTRRDHPVHWGVDLENTDSRAQVRHLKSVHVSKIGRLLGAGTADETDTIKDGLARHRTLGRCSEAGLVARL